MTDTAEQAAAVMVELTGEQRRAVRRALRARVEHCQRSALLYRPGGDIRRRYESELAALMDALEAIESGL